MARIFGDVPLEDMQLVIVANTVSLTFETLVDISETDDPAPVSKRVLLGGETFASVGKPGIQELTVEFADNIAIESIDRMMLAIQNAEDVQVTWETKEKEILPSAASRTVAVPAAAQGDTELTVTWVGGAPGLHNFGPGIAIKVNDRYFPFKSRAGTVDKVRLGKTSAIQAAMIYSLVVPTVVRGPFVARLPGGDATSFADQAASGTLMIQPLTRLPRKTLKY